MNFKDFSNISLEVPSSITSRDFFRNFFKLSFTNSSHCSLRLQSKLLPSRVKHLFYSFLTHCSDCCWNSYEFHRNSFRTLYGISPILSLRVRTRISTDFFFEILFRNLSKDSLRRRFFSENCFRIFFF